MWWVRSLASIPLLDSLWRWVPSEDDHESMVPMTVGFLIVPDEATIPRQPIRASVEKGALLVAKDRASAISFTWQERPQLAMLGR